MSATPTPPASAPRTPPLEDRPELAMRTIELLRTKSALLDLTDAEGRCIVRYMRLVNLPKGTTLFREGESQRTDHMFLVLQGDVSVEMADSTPGEQVPISVLGPGSLVGEMGLIDGSPRSAHCVALNDVLAAGLSRQGMQMLTQEHPAAAARLLVAIAQRIGDRLRAMGEQLRLYAQINADQAAQIERLKRGG
ncbi:MAG: cyclic nucleotide-binding domain-containing protein [Rubrivivax sp.]|jgi:CRP/FNR family cyclic AMP-dependent transcriptional regulator